MNKTKEKPHEAAFETFKKLFRENPQPVYSPELTEALSYLGEMKKPIYILYASILQNIGNPNEAIVEQKIDKPLRFFAVPQKNDIVNLDEKDYIVLAVKHEGFRKPAQKEILYKSAYLYLKEIETPEEFAAIMTNFPI